jgi:hypothetical protein
MLPNRVVILDPNLALSSIQIQAITELPNTIFSLNFLKKSKVLFIKTC